MEEGIIEKVKAVIPYITRFVSIVDILKICQLGRWLSAPVINGIGAGLGILLDKVLNNGSD